MPSGQMRDFEFSMMRADSRHDAATTTTRERTSTSSPVLRSMYATPLARPFPSTRMFFASALVLNSRLLVASARGRNLHGVEKNEPVSHPVVHAPQK